MARYRVGDLVVATPSWTDPRDRIFRGVFRVVSTQANADKTYRGTVTGRIRKRYDRRLRSFSGNWVFREDEIDHEATLRLNPFFKEVMDNK